MRHFLVGIISAASLGFASQTALAQEINISYSEDLLEEFEDSYGEKEKAVLEEALTYRLMKIVEKDDLDISRIDIVIEDVSPNRPTYEQVRTRPGLDQFRSVSIGGAKLTGSVYGADGEILTESKYKSYSHSINDARFGSTWWDAKRAFWGFSKRVSKDIKSS